MRRRWLFFGGFLGFILWGLVTIAGLTIYVSLTLPSEEEIRGPVRNYLAAASLDDAQQAYDQVYQGPGQLFSLRDVERSLSPELYFGYSDLGVDYSFNDEDNGYLRGVMNYRDGSQRRFDAVVRKDDFGWGVYLLRID